MKQLIIPIAIGLLAGLGGGSGYAYMKASAQYVKDSTHVADSLKAHPPADSTESAEHADSSHAPAVDSAAHAAPMTPADSLRALEAARLSLKDATKGVPNAADHATPATEKASAPRQRWPRPRHRPPHQRHRRPVRRCPSSAWPKSSGRCKRRTPPKCWSR